MYRKATAFNNNLNFSCAINKVESPKPFTGEMPKNIENDSQAEIHQRVLVLWEVTEIGKGKAISCPIYDARLTTNVVNTELGSMMAQWLALLPHSVRDPGLTPPSGDCLCGVAHSPRIRVDFLRVL
eukprot:g37536.t1